MMLIRRALDSYLETAAADPADVLTESFGALPDLELPRRDNWDRARVG